MPKKVQNIKLENWKRIPCECGSFATAGAIQYKEYSVRGWKCKKCKREYIHPEDSLKISRMEKLKKGISVTVGQLGASYIIRIPKNVAEIYKIKKRESVTIVPERTNSIEIKISG